MTSHDHHYKEYETEVEEYMNELLRKREEEVYIMSLCWLTPMVCVGAAYT